MRGMQAPAFSNLTEFGLLPTQMADGKSNWCSLSGGQCGPENQESQNCVYPLDCNLISRDLVQRNNKAMGSMAALFIITHTHKGLTSMSITNRLLKLWCIHAVDNRVAIK